MKPSILPDWHTDSKVVDFTMGIEEFEPEAKKAVTQAAVDYGSISLPQWRDMLGCTLRRDNNDKDTTKLDFECGNLYGDQKSKSKLVEKPDSEASSAGPANGYEVPFFNEPWRSGRSDSEGLLDMMRNFDRAFDMFKSPSEREFQRSQDRQKEMRERMKRARPRMA